MYASLYVSGAAVNLGSALLCLGSFGATVICITLYGELSQSILEVIREQPFAKYLIEGLQSDWLRAFVIGAVHVLIPILALLDRLRQKARRCRGAVYGDDKDKNDDKYTPQGRRVVNHMHMWNWVRIFQKTILLGEIFVLLLVGSKWTFVFFSWLNKTLAKAEMALSLLAGCVFGLGWGMFLCPIVPGSAVYLFAGVVLGAQAQLNDGPGIWAGSCIGVVVGTCAKLLACTGQYGMGYAAGTSIRVQQFVGVDKVFTRAMERVLKSPGFNVGKISLLIAGPDFPVSMLCGILKLDIPRMLVGTLPVIVVSIIPQTLVGALLTKDGGDSDAWNMVSTGVTAFAAVFQAGATFVYMFSILRTIEKHGPELAKHRPEHQAVAELTEKELKYVAAYAHCTKWNVDDPKHADQLAPSNKRLVFSAVVCFLLAGIIMCSDFVMTDKYCFRSFAITGDISDSYEKGGLDGNALNLVMPAGWLALGLVVLGFLVNYVFLKRVSAVAKRYESNMAGGTGGLQEEPKMKAAGTSSTGEDSTQKPTETDMKVTEAEGTT
jgi:uncharacterized membrane protein YdjX (TVP38/TMEM64 family)